MEDRRTVKTKKAIRIAFLSLLNEKSLNHITVTELSRRADLGRGTFYLHYKDIYDLNEKIEDELYGKLVQIFDASIPTDSNNLLNLTETITKYIEENRALFLLIVHSSTDGKSMYKLKKIFSERALLADPSWYTSEYDRVEAMFIVSGVIGILEEWLDNGLNMSRSEISTMLHRVLLKF